MKSKYLQMKMTAMAVLMALLLGAIGMTKGYANESTAPNENHLVKCYRRHSEGTISANSPSGGLSYDYSYYWAITTANEGEIVTLTASPYFTYGYILESWTVRDANDNTITYDVTPDQEDPNIATFTMPNGDVEIFATFTRAFLFLAIYEDYQTCEELYPVREWNLIDDVLNMQMPANEDGMTVSWYYQNGANRTTGILWLAQNEKEGFQLYYREQEKERNLRIVVEPFVNSQGEELQHSVYWEEFFYAVPYLNFSAPDSLAEALIPYAGEIHQTIVGHNKVFYVELESTKNQTPGEYVSTITAYDGDEVLSTRTITAKVWNFALPESHYSEVVMGLYNRNSAYKSTSSLFKLNGINVDADGNVAESDLPAAKQILDGYHECLLQHGVSTFEIPRWKMADDPKAAELIMADPRRKVFEVPVHGFDLNGSSFNPDAQAVLMQYKDIVYDNVFLKDKAFFYPMDEPDWDDENIVAQFNTVCNALSESWPDYHASIAFNGNYSQTAEMFEGKIDILCPNQLFFDPWVQGDEIHPDPALYAPKQANFEDFMDRSNHPDRFRTWRYQGDGKCGGTYFWISALSTVGMMRRIVFWQQYRMNSDGWLHWNCAYLPDNWTKKTIPSPFGAATGNGDGILLYPGTMFGQSAETPIVSLRLKQLSAGIDDYDYLRLGDEFLTQADIDYVFTYSYINNTTVHCYLLNKQYDYYTPYTCTRMYRARYELGQRLDTVNTEHTWDEWQTAVLPDETHNGMEIRTCSHCGTQESRSKTYSSLYRFVGTENNQWANLSNWANSPETLPAPGEAVVIASNCEINTNTTVFHVVVNDGVNLTIKDGATLTSRRVSTEGNAQVIIEDGAQLYTQSEGVQATVMKNIAAHSESGGWHFISSSVATDVAPSTDNGLVSSTQTNYDLYYYDEPAHYWRNYKHSSNPNITNADPDFSIAPMKGYLYANADGTTLSFAGTLQPGITAISTPLSYEAQTLTGWNLVGNPFPCNVYVDKSYYVLNENGSAIYPTPVSIGTAIGPCTGIMVKAEGPDETVTFSKTAPETQGQNNGLLHIALNQTVFNRASVSTGSTTLDKTIVSFNEGDLLGKFYFGEQNANLYIPQNGKEYAIAFSKGQSEIPLNFKANENGIYTILINPEGVELAYLHLIDNMTGADVDLLQNPSYNFNAKTTDYESRFKLVFASVCEDADSDSDSDADFAFISDGNLIINGEGMLQVIDMQGRVIRNVGLSQRVSRTTVVGMTPGVYMLRLVNGEKVRTQKIVVK